MKNKKKFIFNSEVKEYNQTNKLILNVKMEVPAEILEKLKCNRCNGVLSSAPVHLTNEMKVICGQCSVLEDEETIYRMDEYEAVASLLKFPCKNQENGCSKIINFNDPSNHEPSCNFNCINCPVKLSGSCEWTGIKTELYKHVQDKHPDSLLENSCSLSHDITTSNEKTFLLLAFNVLFLLHTKVCVVTKKIYHSLRHFGDPNLASNYSFTLSIKRDEFYYSRNGKVVAEELRVMQINTSVETEIDCLLGMMDVYEGTVFNITVKKLVEDEEDSNREIVLRKCGKCLDKIVYQKSYRKNNSWWCDTCSPERRVCKNNLLGCTHMDIPNKCTFHEDYYCKYRTNCDLCSKTLNGEALLQHYTLEHSDITCRSNGEWCITFDTSWNQFYFSHEIDEVLIWYRKNNGLYEIDLGTASTPTYNLYNCILHVTDPITLISFQKKMNVVYNREENANNYLCDYYTTFEAKDFQSNKLLIKLEITKIH